MHKKHFVPRGQKNNRTNTRTTQLCICNKKRKRGNEKDTKPKQEELNKLINKLKNLIEILKMITKETIKEHILTVPDKCKTHNQNQEKKPIQKKIQTKQKKKPTNK